MTTFYFIRHGSRVSRSEDTILSDIGIKQAEVTAYFLKGRDISIIYASPLKRTQQTAQIINNVLHVSIITDDRLKERLIFDEKKDKTFNQFLDEWNKSTADRNYQSTYGDSAINTGNKVKSLLDEVAENKNIVVVSHGGVIGDFLRNCFSDEQLPFQEDTTVSLKYVEILECSITIVERRDGLYSLKKVNDISHLSIPLL